MTEETKLKIRVKEWLVLDGVTHKPGDVLELPERQALGLISENNAEQIPEGAPDTPEEGTMEQVGEANEVAGEVEHEDPKKAKQLEDAKKHDQQQQQKPRRK